MRHNLNQMASNQRLIPAHRDSMSFEDDESKEVHIDERQRSQRLRRIPRAALLASILLNVGLAYFMLLQNTSIQSPGFSRSGSITTNFPTTAFAGLARNIPKQWDKNVATTLEEWNGLWNSTPFWPGIISLPDSYARSKGLPRSQRFPWDRERGIYVINAYHSFHCVLNIKQAIEEYRDGQPQSIRWSHVQHCLLVLRDEIMCNADDTPRYTGFQREGSSGYGQTRMCRDRTKLEEWAMAPEQESCWRNAKGVLGDRPNATRKQVLDRYRYCNDDSPYKEVADSAWTDPADWE